MSLPDLSLSQTPHAIVGVDGCRSGWIAAIRFADGTFAAEPSARFADLLAFLPGDAVVAVDMPIGLADRLGPGGRGPDAALRRFLGRDAPSVFSIPSRAAVFAAPGPFPGMDARLAGFREALRVARDTSEPPTGFSVQGFGLFPKIRELDGLLQANAVLRQRVFESHPEAAFRRLNGYKPLGPSKKTPAGARRRRDLLVATGLPRELLAARFPGVGLDDLLDAAVLLFSAARYAAGQALCFPDPPGADAFGIPMAIRI